MPNPAEPASLAQYAYWQGKGLNDTTQNPPCWLCKLTATWRD